MTAEAGGVPLILVQPTCPPAGFSAGCLFVTGGLRRPAVRDRTRRGGAPGQVLELKWPHTRKAGSPELPRRMQCLRICFVLPISNGAGPIRP